MLAAMMSIAACGDDGTAGTGGGGGDDGATSTADTTGAGGAGGAGGGATVETSELSAFTMGPTLAERRDHHVTFVVDRGAGARFLYVMGGAQDMTSLVGETERAPILDDGSLGALEVVEPTLPVGGAGVAVRGDRALIFGGQRFTGVTAHSKIVPIAADGSLGEPEEGPAMSVGRFHVGGAQVGDFVYAVGGLEDRDGAPWSTETVEVIRLDDDGVGTWALTTPLPGPRSHHVVTAHGGYLYVAGGLDRPGDFTKDVSLPDVVRAPIGADGMLGAWETMGTLPTDLAVAAAVTRGDQLWIVGGLTSGAHEHGTTGELVEFSTHVLRSTIDGGALGPWEIAGDLPLARGHAHHAPVHGDVLYSAGGHGNDARSQGEIVFARFE